MNDILKALKQVSECLRELVDESDEAQRPLLGALTELNLALTSALSELDNAKD